MQSRGIEHVKVPAAHAQNGVERVHLTILNGVRTVLAHSGLGAQFWAELYIAYTLVPDDSWQNKESRLDHLQPFGCHVYRRSPSKLALATKKVLLWDTSTALTTIACVEPTAIKS